MWLDDVDQLADEMHSPVTVRSPAFRSMALKRAKAFSIGLKCGL
jgi:hypothetical protein